MQEILTTEIEYQTPLAVYNNFAQLPWSVLLDSGSEATGYSFIGVDPFQTMTSKNGTIFINNACYNGNPFIELEHQLKKFKLDYSSDLAPLKSGVIGYFGYDLYQHLEKIPKSKKDDLNFPDLALGFYDLIIGFDLGKKRAWIFASGLPETTLVLQQARAKKRTAWLLKKLVKKNITQSRLANHLQPQRLSANFSHKTYLAAVTRVLEYINAGDIFQANLSQRFDIQLPNLKSPFTLYQLLRERTHAPFSSYLNMNNYIIASASPERFLKLTQREIETQPIKGTRPRSPDPTVDKKLANELVMSIKDQAENIMIVDLLRNDLSRVCDHFSVHVPQLCELKSFTTVHHLVSTITGELASDKTNTDLLIASFPGGSISGAPKIRAMEIIAEIEPTQRGPYYGCIGYIGFNGDMDTAITIRSYLINNQTVSFQVGGGIVADSDPQIEYEETLVKAEALFAALK